MFLRSFFDADLAQYSYMIGCQKTGEAIVIDPARDITPYIKTAKKEGFHLAAAAETHIHADFVSGARELAEKHDVTLYLSDEGDESWKYQYLTGLSYELVKEGSIINVGNVELEVLHTPGHTPESISFLLTDKGGGSEVPMGIFTGDFVFVGDVGRPDLLEKAAGVKGTSEKGAKDMFHSLKKFKELPDYCMVWPGHGAGSACGKSLGAVPQSTVGYEKINNWALKINDEAEFAKALLSDQPEAPSYFAMMKKVNKEGPALLSEDEVPFLEGEKELKKAVEEGESSVLIDTRPAKDYAEGHIKGSINIPYNKIFTNWAGWIVGYDQDIILITDEIDQVVKSLHSIGFDRIKGYTGTDVLQECKGNLETYSTESVNELMREYDDSSNYVIDVRNDQEWKDGHIPGAHHFMLGHLKEHVKEIPENKKLIVHCQSGARSAIATSLLQANGFKQIVNMDGGIAAWKKADGPVEKE
ncbi:MBL fold metallo-hydrolase [Falsibacillus albus]|uniref:MBL fold metallo-hydrolase n=1 Tax=Falsibacillus albus TaxID=2478915 RepID=A0A3L7K0V8_9BACI|nr:MBL fold metallo-hydrolase [Falsibacillus albus]RLQ96717.1 MBL fold metallo-hydrolase [Falsibacillus albus]